MGALTGGLIGTVLGGFNPLMGIVGATLGGLLGGTMGSHQQGSFCNQHNPAHQQCASYPPGMGHHFGGPQYGGYNQSPQMGMNPYGQPHWGNPAQCGPNMNFNFGHQCPPSRCCPQQPQQGQLQQEKEGKPITYTTAGGYTVHVDKHTITITDPNGKNEVKHWGDPHEKLNGKHIKDWEGKQRTLILGDGTKITMSADGPKGVTLNTSIYDGNQNVQINNSKNEVWHHSLNPYDTMHREMTQYDGETSVFFTQNNGSAVYNTIYQQDDKFNITPGYKALGATGSYTNPSKVYNFYKAA